MGKPTCDVCSATLHSLFTGIVVMTKNRLSKTVCGHCAAQLEKTGWIAVSQVK